MEGRVVMRIQPKTGSCGLVVVAHIVENESVGERSPGREWPKLGDFERVCDCCPEGVVTEGT